MLTARYNSVKRIAAAAAVAILVYSCGGKLSEAEKLNLETTPLQRVEKMKIVRTENGVLKMRGEADLMEKYETDTTSYELFPKGIAVYVYSEGEVLETTLLADQALHVTYKKTSSNPGEAKETWSAFGHVEIHNLVNHQTMETDTLYWDQEAEQLYTDSYVRMYSPDGFMQGYGMRSDQKANDSVLLHPFNSYSVVVQDSTAVLIDSVNFIGPFAKK